MTPRERFTWTCVASGMVWTFVLGVTSGVDVLDQLALIFLVAALALSLVDSIRYDRALRAGNVRPRHGKITRPDGTKIEFLFVPTSEPNKFLAVTADGDRVKISRRDKLEIDAIAPGQEIVIEASPDEAR